MQKIIRLLFFSCQLLCSYSLIIKLNRPMLLPRNLYIMLSMNILIIFLTNEMDVLWSPSLSILMFLWWPLKFENFCCLCNVKIFVATIEIMTTLKMWCSRWISKTVLTVKYKLSGYSVLCKVLKKLWIKNNSTPPPKKKKYLKRLANESNINTICLLYDIRKTFKIIVS